MFHKLSKQACLRQTGMLQKPYKAIKIFNNEEGVRG
jgi:hypothetical protein